MIALIVGALIAIAAVVLVSLPFLRSSEDDVASSTDLQDRRLMLIDERDRTLAALKECGAVYLNGIGGAAQYYARTVEEVLGVNLIEFGIPEAMWHIRVRNFAAIVTMDAHGNSLHADIEHSSATILARLAEPVFR